MAADFNLFDRGLSYEVETNYAVVNTRDFRNSPQSFRDTRGSKQKTFKVTFKTNTREEILAIRDYFIARQGSFESFPFTDPLEGITYTVRFQEDSFTIERQEIGVFNAKVTLMEELNV